MYANTFDGTDPQAYLAAYRCGNEPKPESLDDMVDFLVIRLLDGLEEDLGPLDRWQGPVA